MKKSIYEKIVLLLFMAGGAVYLSEGLTKNILSSAFSAESTKPYDVPNIVVGIVMVLCAILLVKNILEDIKEKKAALQKEAAAEVAPLTEEELAAQAEEQINKKKVLITLLLIIAYVIAWKFLGFYIATPLFIFADSLVLPEKKNIKLALLSAVATTVICYLVFTLLFKIRFPFPLF